MINKEIIKSVGKILTVINILAILITLISVHFSKLTDNDSEPGLFYLICFILIVLLVSFFVVYNYIKNQYLIIAGTIIMLILNVIIIKILL